MAEEILLMLRVPLRPQGYLSKPVMDLLSDLKYTVTRTALTLCVCILVFEALSVSVQIFHPGNY